MTHLRSLLFAVAAAVTVTAIPSAHALDSAERELFGLAALEQTRPEVDGSGYSVGVADTEFDLTHPGLGWTGADEFDLWLNNRAYIPMLNRVNPRIYAAGHNPQTVNQTAFRHGRSVAGFQLPLTYNNTLMTNIWGPHGTAVAGTAAGGEPGPAGVSRGAAPRARLVFAGNTATFNYLVSMVPDGNPTRTVAMNRSFTGSSSVDATVRRNSGIIAVNAAGNYFSSIKDNRMEVFGISPHLASVRWMTAAGYDLIASGLSVQNGTQAYASSGGSMRNQESIFTDYSVRTIRPDRGWDSYASGTSFASPLLAGGVTLVQQAYERANPGRWLRVDQMDRILKRSGKFVDDIYTGLRYPVADFRAAALLAETYAGDPSREPNFTTDFDPGPRIENTALVSTNLFLNPLYFRVSTFYGTNHYTEYTTARVHDGRLNVIGHAGGGEVNIAVRNGWGDLAVVDLTEPGKQLSLAFNYDTVAGNNSGHRTEFFVGVREMFGSAQFMDANREHDNTDRGRLAFRISHQHGDAQARIDLLQCVEAPSTFGTVWTRLQTWVLPAWSTPLATLTHAAPNNGTSPRLEARFTGNRAVLLLNGSAVIDAAHSVPHIALTRATPYFHFINNNPAARQRLGQLAVATGTASSPRVTLEVNRNRAVEGVPAPAASGVFTVRRSGPTGSPLTVNYFVGGTAINGQDYTTLPGALTIPAGAASADLLVAPLSDATVESDETVILTLAAGSAYTLGAAVGPETVTLVDHSDVDGDGLWSWDEDSNGNGNLSDDDPNGNLLPAYLDGLDRSPTNNLPPVALAGPDRATTGTVGVVLNGAASYDPDGSVAGFLWTVLPGSQGPVTIDQSATATPTVRWTEAASSNRTAQIELAVTDAYGAVGRDTVTVTQVAGQQFSRTYGTLFFRGTPNGWGRSLMTLVDHYTWEIEVAVTDASGASFKFDAWGDWSLNFGDNNDDSFAEQNGSNIGFREGAGTYRIRFNDQTRWYQVVKLVVNQPPTADAGPDQTVYQMEPATLFGGNSYDNDGAIVAYQWTIIEGESGPVSLTNPDNATATLAWHAPTISSRVARVRLTVTDIVGATASDTVTVTQTSTLVFQKTYPQVHARGTANGWGTSAMTLISNYTWAIDQTFSGAPGDRFKFDVYGDWSLNFGDNNNDGIADQSGGDIAITQGAGTYTLWFNDQTRRYGVVKQIVNQPPVAHPGPDQTVSLAGATLQLNGGGSYDPDGSIIEYSWTQSSGPIAPITFAHPGNPNATVVILSRTNAAVYTFSLRVTDNDGAMSTGTVTVTQQAAGFNKVHPQVYFRGTANAWGTTAMTLVSNYLWETMATFGGVSGDRFKLDVHGDWSLNFGDNNQDGIADQAGADIAITQGAGDYRIRFNDQTRAYSVVKVGGAFVKDHASMTVAGSFNGWSPSADNLTLIADHTWSGTFVLNGSVQFKFAANGGWAANWGEANQPGTGVPLNGTAENDAGNINLANLGPATYRITFHERTRAYSVVLVGGTEAGADRVLVGWEAQHGLDLFAADTATTDADGDGLTHLDEYHLGTNPFAADSDRDGMNDREEVIAGTRPLDAASVFAVNATIVDGQLVLEWESQPNRVYTIESSAVYDWQDPIRMEADGKQGPATFAPTGNAGFFRIVVSEPGIDTPTSP